MSKVCRGCKFLHPHMKIPGRYGCDIKLESRQPTDPACAKYEKESATESRAKAALHAPGKKVKFPTWFVTKHGSGYRPYSVKGVYGPPMWIGAGAKKGAEDYVRWQHNVNRLHAVIKKYGHNYVVYINNGDFKTKAAATTYAMKLHGPVEWRDR
jgi:hypothetical protein